MTAVREITHKLREGKDSDVVEGAERTGLTARGVLYLLVALLAAKMAFGANDQPADKQGALRSLADNAFGRILLVALTIGFGAYALWRLAEAAAGHRTEDEARKRWMKRAGSLGKAGLYAGLGATAASTFVDEKKSPADGNKQERTLTAEVLDWPVGGLIVGLVGLVIIGIAGYLIYRGVARKFEKKLKTGEMPPIVRRWATPLGVIGHTSRGLVVGLLGVLLIRSAVHHDPNKAQGVDGTLRTIALAPYGRPLLLLASVGLAAFGLHALVEARYRRT